MAGNMKGKNAMQTPFRPATLARKAIHLGKSNILPSGPLGDKTPFPNRQQVRPLQTPAPQTGKLAQLASLDPLLSKTPGALLLPSARRKSLRLPRSASKKFTTPLQQGNYWDVSDGDLEADVSGGSVDLQEVRGPDYDEIEYMPPKLPGQPYEPPFDMPNFASLGQVLLRTAHADLYDDGTDRYYAVDIALQIDDVELLKESGAFADDKLVLSELGKDDPFEAAPYFPSAPSTILPTTTSTRPLRSTTTTKKQPTAASAPSRPVTRAGSSRSTSKILECNNATSRGTAIQQPDPHQSRFPSSGDRSHGEYNRTWSRYSQTFTNQIACPTPFSDI
ncbi:hypothetical protein EW026_g1406 [Hermanssonia centrifuga]|uniref:Uncharacterized protein n=1 Tax=Hermanssonia centrifuga TaxID=98765 RepID=A0A4V3XBC0_9APHY|nr:hypothetical protein EW026_g1406 [Hermanssonia centrifuga]